MKYCYLLNIDREEAIAKLADCQPNTFLVRPRGSSEMQDLYMVDIKRNNGVINRQLIRNDSNGFYYPGYETRYKSINNLVQKILIDDMHLNPYGVMNPQQLQALCLKCIRQNLTLFPYREEFQKNGYPEHLINLINPNPAPTQSPK